MGSLLADIKTLGRGGNNVVGDDPGEWVLDAGIGVMASVVDVGFSVFFPFF